MDISSGHLIFMQCVWGEKNGAKLKFVTSHETVTDMERTWRAGQQAGRGIKMSICPRLALWHNTSSIRMIVGESVNARRDTARLGEILKKGPQGKTLVSLGPFFVQVYDHDLLHPIKVREKEKKKEKKKFQKVFISGHRKSSLPEDHYLIS